MSSEIEYEKLIVEYLKDGERKSYHIFVAKADCVNIWTATSIGGLNTEPFLKALPLEIENLEEAVAYTYKMLDEENKSFNRRSK